MIRKLWVAFFMIFNRNRIPPLPRGMLASEYKDVASPERRIMARLGTRDIIGVRFAMKREGVETIEDLAAKLEHYQPQRNILNRIRNGMGRVYGGLDYDPHAEDMRRVGSAYHARKARQTKEIADRVKIARKAFKELNQ